MQTITLYVNAESTLGVVRDYANARNASAPTLTRGVSACLKMRIFASGENADPYPLNELVNIPAWQWVMDDDFDSGSNYILVADHAGINVQSVTEIINETEYTFTEFTIPLSKMNTAELNTLLGKQEQVATLNGELVGPDESGSEVFVLQVKEFTVRNRISSTGNPTEIAAEYLMKLKSGHYVLPDLNLSFLKQLLKLPQIGIPRKEKMTNFSGCGSKVTAVSGKAAMLLITDGVTLSDCLPERRANRERMAKPFMPILLLPLPQTARTLLQTEQIGPQTTSLLLF